MATSTLIASTIGSETFLTKGTDIFRSKGILSVAGMEERYVFQGVHMLIDGQPNGTWG